MGFTSYACSPAGEIVSYIPKKIGNVVETEKSFATVESGKWVGPVKTPDVQGWVVKIKPVNQDADAATLKSGASALAAFETKMQADGFKGC